jgi:thymidylate synthase (FAD)
MWENEDFDHPDFEAPNYLSGKDSKLVHYLAKHNHWSPFAHCFLSFRIKAPIFVARQLVKHQVGLAWNEESRRYIDSPPEFWLPKLFHGRPENAKQGSSENKVDPSSLWGFSSGPEDLNENTEGCLDLYKHLLAEGVAPEEARIVLPQNTMTNWIWSGSLYAFARVVNLRTDSHAQKAGTREVAHKIAAVLKDLFPVSYEALCPKVGGDENV